MREGGSSSGYREHERIHAHQEIWFYKQTKPNRDTRKGRVFKTAGEQNGCVPNESKQLIIYAYWEFLRTEISLRAPSGGLGTGPGQQVYLLESICMNNK